MFKANIQSRPRANKCIGCGSAGVLYAYNHFFCPTCLGKVEENLKKVTRKVANFNMTLKDALKQTDNPDFWAELLDGDGEDWIRIGKLNESLRKT